MTLRVWTALVVLIMLSGCSVVRNYDKELSIVSQQLAQDKSNLALETLNANNKKDKDLLYYLEAGQLLRLKGDLPASQAAWMQANNQIIAWEEAVKANPRAYVSGALSYVVNDKVRGYYGHDYEKVMLTTQMALNFMAMGDFNSARVAIKQTHEREALISRLHENLYLDLEQKARDEGVSTRIKDLNGYPIGTLNSPEVIGLKNSYQSAFSHYLAGYIYEALGEKDLAAAGYRNAIELNPNVPMLEDALKNLTANPNLENNQSDVLIVMQSGLAPKLQSMDIGLPILTPSGIVNVNASFPVVEAVGLGGNSPTVSVNGKPQILAELTKVDAMSRKAMWDELPEIILRTTVRATTRAVTQYQLNKQVSPWAGLAFGIMGMIVEQADTRTWRTLPDSMRVARVSMPKGLNTITLPNGQQVSVNISKHYEVIEMTQVGDKVYLTQ